MCDTPVADGPLVRVPSGYDDLIRIWTTDGIARWFSEIGAGRAVDADSIVALERAGRKADQMAYNRLRAHSDLLPDSPQQICNGIDQQDSWSGDTPETVLLPLSDPAKTTGQPCSDGWLHL